MYAQLFMSWISLAVSILIGSFLASKVYRVDKGVYIVVAGALAGAGLQIAHTLFVATPLRWFIYLVSYIVSFILSYILFSKWGSALRFKVILAALIIIFLHTIFRVIILINW